MERDSAERGRICEAMLDLVVERSFKQVTVDDLVERASVERASFDEHFDGLDDCFMQTYESIAAEYDASVFGAYEGGVEWRDKLRAAAYAGAEWLRDHPRETRFGTVEMLSGPQLANVSFEARLKSYIDLIDAGREVTEDPEARSRAVAEAAVGSIVTLLMKKLNEGIGPGEAVDLVPELMCIAVRPYLGEKAALEELRMPADGHEQS